ncbi:MAG: S1 RNA-binding domain-containing protein [Clostridiales bacterium]|nr:S1 RNA-binding domain-containing protein [Clostridiales bacterium]
MEFVIGTVLEGKVSGITKFGAFVTIGEGVTGLVHISEVSNTYVSDISEHLQMGQTVKVKIIDIKDGKYSLSIKKAESPLPKPAVPQRGAYKEAAPPILHGELYGDEPVKDQAFEDKLKSFMQDSDSRMSDLRNIQDRKRPSRRRK